MINVFSDKWILEIIPHKSSCLCHTHTRAHTHTHTHTHTSPKPYFLKFLCSSSTTNNLSWNNNGARFSSWQLVHFTRLLWASTTKNKPHIKQETDTGPRGKKRADRCPCVYRCVWHSVHVWGMSVWYPSAPTVQETLTVDTWGCVCPQQACRWIPYWTKGFFCGKTSCYYYESNGGYSVLAAGSTVPGSSGNAQKMKISGKWSGLLSPMRTLLAVCICP